MNGIIYFQDEQSLAAFLRALVGSTALFEVVEQRGDPKGAFKLTFTGGY